MVEERITILGAGSMGTALARMIAEGGGDTCLWAYEKEVANEINEAHLNQAFLPGFDLPQNLRATTDLSEALRGASLVLSATPSQVLRGVWQRASAFLEEDAIVVCASKGVERGSGALMSEVLEAVLGSSARSRLAFLSGPSFAKEIAEGQPTAVVVAGSYEPTGVRVQNAMSCECFRIYTTDDVVGVELGGALKNVIAIAVGAAEGLRLGLNSRAALITRGLAEISRLAVACGANPLTLAGLAGIGDLVLTCTGQLSRNLQVGIRIGKGEKLFDILSSTRTVAEGVETARSTLELACRIGIEMPITEVVVRLIDGQLLPHEAVSELMSRPLKAEREHG
ncbi:MAG: NAD(P)-dependent glycerol-3-phosphate dehydrogenase [Myxococcota bacterium]|jgi:glycerol-3-phosphate dehydrogenase (NAD(P)+)|nr:NAD(P)-dependent glycerol-3-phosphate dehydrogenase [Myxococcota bacterium]